MIGLPFNPNNCAFVSNQALNANQFNGNVSSSSNNTTHTVLWDFVAEKLYWVNTLTNLIEAELPGANAGNLDADIEQTGSTINGYEYTCTPSGGVGDSALTFNTLVGGTGYAEGTYVVATTGGAGSNASATITVNASGVVTSAVVNYGGTGYVVGNTLTLVGGNNNATVNVATIDPYLYQWDLKSGPDGDWTFFGATNAKVVTIATTVAGLNLNLLRCRVTDLQGYITTSYIQANFTPVIP